MSWACPDFIAVRKTLQQTDSAFAYFGSDVSPREEGSEGFKRTREVDNIAKMLPPGGENFDWGMLFEFLGNPSGGFEASSSSLSSHKVR